MMKKGSLTALFVPILLTVFTVGCAIQKETTNAAPAFAQEQIIDPLVTADWLRENMSEPGLVIIDATVEIQSDESGQIQVSSGETGYLASHIPSARFADLTTHLADTSSRYPYALPSPEEFAEAMGTLGVGDDNRVVIYARGYSAWAARVWWMLRWIGFENAAVLDGGFDAWTEAGFPVSSGPLDVETQSLSIKLRPGLIADRDDVFAAISDPNVRLIDAMPEAHYRGEMQMYARKGHIPTAINIPTVFEESGRLMSLADLEIIHGAKAIEDDKNMRTIIYCGGGISASANAFAMHLLGFDDVAVYIGSLEEWTDDMTNPMTIEVNE